MGEKEEHVQDEGMRPDLGGGGGGSAARALSTP